MDVGAAFPTGGQASELVQQGEGLLDDPAHGLVVVPGATSADQWLNASMAQQVSVLVAVIAPVGDQNVGLASRSGRSPAHGRDGLDQREKFGDVVAVAAGQAGRERDSPPSQIRWCFEPVLPRSTGLGPVADPPFRAGVGGVPRDQSLCPAALSSAGKTSWSWSKTPASCQSRRRRQQVIPEPNPSSCGRSSQPTPVNNTNRMPCSTWRSGSGFGPVRLAGRTGFHATHYAASKEAERKATASRMAKWIDKLPDPVKAATLRGLGPSKTSHIDNKAIRLGAKAGGKVPFIGTLITSLGVGYDAYQGKDPVQSAASGYGGQLAGVAATTALVTFTSTPVGWAVGAGVVASFGVGWVISEAME